MTRNQFLLIFISIILMSCSSLTDRPDKSLKKVSAPSGDFFGIENEENYIFKGIPYAQAPVGDLRWKAPREYTPTKSIYATDFGNECVQPGDDYVLGVYRRSNTIGEEDCLYLNIFIPKKGEVLESNSFPVMFWIHGGANIYGSANTYDFQNLIKKDVIVVSINYRLGPFGWFSSDFIRDDASGLDLTSNFAHLDMIQAHLNGLSKTSQSLVAIQIILRFSENLLVVTISLHYWHHHCRKDFSKKQYRNLVTLALTPVSYTHLTLPTNA